MTQTELILNHLKQAPITPLQALEKYGCFRLAARIKDLRESGHNITTQSLHTNNGKVIAQYVLVDKK